MENAIQFLVRHGYAVLFLWVGAEQLGLPLPAVPLLLAAGALAGAGKLDAGIILAAAVLASLFSDTIWFEIGRRKGVRVLNFLCRVSLEPDSCVRRTEEVFLKHGAKSLLLAKFLPGLNTAAPPLAGIFRMPLSRFLIFDGLGALLWAGTFVLLGYVFSGQLERVAEYALPLGTWLVVILLGALGAYVGWKYFQRQRFLRQLRIARITPDELKTMLDAGQKVVVVDMRGEVEFQGAPEMIPGAVHMAAAELDEAAAVIPRDRDIILYCS